MLNKSCLLIGILTAPCILAQSPELISIEPQVYQNTLPHTELAFDKVQSCYYFPDMTAYFLSKRATNFLVNIPEGTEAKSIEFNFCGQPNTRQQCKDSKGKATLLKQDDTCVNLADSGNGQGNSFTTSDANDKSPNSEDGGLTVTYSGGDKCASDANQNYGLQVRLYCTEKKDLQGKAEFEALEGCDFIVGVYDEQGCYVFDSNPLIRFLSRYSYVFGAFLILVGIVVAVFGKPLFKPTICIVGTLVFNIALSLFIFSIFFTRNTPEWAGWVVYSATLVVGCIVGLILAKLTRLGVAVLAGWGGFCLGMIIYSAFLYKADGDKNILFWCFNIGMAILAGVLSLFLFNHAVIIATAIVGSYAFIRGISLYAGGYPDEMQLIQMIKYNGLGSIDPRFYGYMAGFIVATIISIVMQYKFWMKEKNHQHKHPYYKYK